MLIYSRRAKRNSRTGFFASFFPKSIWNWRSTYTVVYSFHLVHVWQNWPGGRLLSTWRLPGPRDQGLLCAAAVLYSVNYLRRPTPVINAWKHASLAAAQNVGHISLGNMSEALVQLSKMAGSLDPFGMRSFPRATRCGEMMTAWQELSMKRTKKRSGL